MVDVTIQVRDMNMVMVTGLEDDTLSSQRESSPKAQVVGRK